MIKSILKLNYISWIALLATIVSGSLASCDKSDSSGGAPYISYVRVTNPTSKDSLLVAAGQGQMIAIVGGNLQNTKQIWFNDQQAELTPTLISNTAIIVSVPTLVPLEVNNKMKLIFANKDSLLYDFTVTISKPVIDGSNKLKPNGMDCEYVSDGEIATIHGNYFYLPISVTFQGDVTATSEDGDVTVNDKDLNFPNTILTVKVPDGAQSGPITITDNFGTTTSDFWFRDNRNIVEGFDGSNDPGTNGTVVTAPGAGDPPLINGNYCRVVKPNMGGWDWTQVYARWSAPWCQIPDEAISHPELYYYKFEVNTVKPFDSNGVRLWVSDTGAQNTGPYYNWMPPLDTKGAWQTIVIPFEDIMSANSPLGILSGGYFSAFVFCEGGGLDCDMSFDNFRIVPKAIY